MAYCAIPEHFFKRMIIGMFAFALLLGSEFVLAANFFGRTPQEFLAAIKTLPGTLGLAGQGLFALFPILQVNIKIVTR